MQNLPTGTVTFLYTDVESSTRLWESQPEAMRAAIDRHDAILRSAIEAHGGQVFRTAGDALCAAFETAAPALAAAVTAQRGIFAEPWPLERPLRVRIVLHTTEAEVQGGDYVGAGLNRLGRLLAVCHGGQTLLTQATEQLARDHLPAGASLLDLGQHRFRDLAQPYRIFQLIVPGLPAEFPPLKSLDAIPNNLPAQLTSFVGRERELEEVVESLLPENLSPQPPPLRREGEPERRRRESRAASTSASAYLPAAPSASPSPPRRGGRGERLLTLTGPGGTGKTRLSLQAAAEVLRHFPDGVWFVELAPISDPALVVQAVAAVLGLREIAGRPLDAMVSTYLRDKRVLLVLDNCEHLIDACAHLADLLLRTCPDLRILASSRELLGIAGEIVFRVPSLAIPDMHALPPFDQLAHFESVQLFAERAASVQPSFRLTPQNAAAVAQISCRLDGIPLALELAAARVRSLSPEQIAIRLDDRFRLLTGGSRAAVQRQQTLQALIDWSYDLLSLQECTLLRRLAVFAGGWTLEAAEGVCAWGEVDALDVLDLLDRLVSKSLVNAEDGSGEVRYRMQETIRQYAQDKLVAAGEATAARNRHLSYFAAQLAQAGSRWGYVQRITWMRWVGQERDNLRSAVEWALETDLEATLDMVYNLGYYWPQVGSATAGRQFVARALAQTEAQADVWHGDRVVPRRRRLLAGAWFADGFMANSIGASAATLSSMDKAIALLQPLGETHLLAGAYGFAGIGALNGGDIATAIAYGGEALRLARQAGDRWTEAMQLISVGMVGAYSTGKRGEAWANWEEGMAIMGELGDSWGEAMGYMIAGNAALRHSDLPLAREYYEQSSALFDGAGYAQMANVGGSGLADVARLQGDYARALALYPSVIHTWRLGDHRGAIARCLECLGFIAGLQAVDAAAPLPLLRRAATLYGAAEMIRRTNGTPMNPWEESEYGEHVDTLRRMLDSAELAAAWQAGQQMDLDQAVAYAIQASTS